MQSAFSLTIQAQRKSSQKETPKKNISPSAEGDEGSSPLDLANFWKSLIKTFIAANLLWLLQTNPIAEHPSTRGPFSHENAGNAVIPTVSSVKSVIKSIKNLGRKHSDTNGFAWFNSHSKTACREFESFCPCHEKAPEISDFGCFSALFRRIASRSAVKKCAAQAS